MKCLNQYDVTGLLYMDMCMKGRADTSSCILVVLKLALSPSSLLESLVSSDDLSKSSAHGCVQGFEQVPCLNGHQLVVGCGGMSDLRTLTVT